MTAYESTFGPNHKLLREIRLQETDHIISVFQTLQIQRKKTTNWILYKFYRHVLLKINFLEIKQKFSSYLI